MNPSDQEKLKKLDSTIKSLRITLEKLDAQIEKIKEVARLYKRLDDFNMKIITTLKDKYSSYLEALPADQRETPEDPITGLLTTIITDLGKFNKNKEK